MFFAFETKTERWRFHRLLAGRLNEGGDDGRASDWR